ncbi:MAG: hypothetical protein KDA91_17600, partial [Planctomycetaceae bacterium]|nr:hypothetical protein [Planctomycetaceae bacterium]
MSDVDAQAGSIQVTLSATNGTLTLASTTGLTFSTGDGTADSTIAVTGTVASINAALDGMTFSPTASFNGTAVINILTEDLGNTGTGGNLTDSDQLNIQVGGIRFQEGVDGYVGTEDTFVRQYAAFSSFGNDTIVETNNWSGFAEQGLIRFENLFGAGAGQIPVGATIANATLSVYVSHRNDTAPASVVGLYKMNQTWSESSTWSSMVGGISTNGTEAAAVASDTISATTAGWVTFTNLAADLQGWANGDANYGWSLLTNDSDAWEFISSENSNVTLRPYLTIAYLPPQPAAIDLDANDSSGATGTAFNGSFTENGGPVLIADSDATLTDSDSTHLNSMTVTISNLLDGAAESLAANTTGTSITASYDSGTGVLTLSGTDTIANYQQVLRTIRYNNTSEDPTTTDRTIEFVASDAFVSSLTATTTLQIVALNDAPVLDNAGTMTLNTISISDLNNHGNTIGQIIASAGSDRIIDADADNEGIAVYATTAANGTWEYSIDDGASWNPIGVVSASQSLLLRDSDLVRLVPSGTVGNSNSISFRAWDQSVGIQGTKVDSSVNGGTSAFSTSTETASINVAIATGQPIATYDWVAVSPNTPTTINVTSNDYDPQGDPLTVLDVTNPSHGSLTYSGSDITYTSDIAYLGTDSVQYLVTDGNDSLTNYWKLDGNAIDSIGSIDGTLVNSPTTTSGYYGQALHFNGTDEYVELGDVTYNSEFSLSFYFKVDDNSGTSIQYLYSHGAVANSNMVFVALAEDNFTTVSQRKHIITTILDSKDNVTNGQSFVDISSLIADGNWHMYTATVTPGTGTRVYIDGLLKDTINRGGEAINPTGNAYIGTRSDLDPNRYFNGSIDSVAVYDRALSSTEISERWSGSGPVGTLDISVNDAPTVVTTSGSSAYVENAPAVAVDGSITISDTDSATLTAATIRISGNYSSGQDQLHFVNQNGITGTWNASTGTLSLTGNASLANYQTALRSITFDNASEMPSTALRTISFSVNDGFQESAAQTRTLTVESVNDTPQNFIPGTRTTGVNSVLTMSGTLAMIVSDVDAANNPLRVTLSATNGLLSLSTLAGLSFDIGDGTSDSTMRFSGTLSSINAALDGLQFTPDTDFAGTAQVSILTEDLGNTGTGGSLSDADIVEIIVGGVRFQEGVDSYTGTEDTYVSQAAATTSFGSSSSVTADNVGSTANGLIRFDNMFGTNPGQIEYGSTILSASLSIYVTNTDSAETLALRQMLSTWSEASTWNTTVNGIQVDGAEASLAIEATIDAGQSGWVTITGLQDTVQQWADGSDNYGWAVISAAADNWIFESSESATVALRPYLAIEYTLPQAPKLDLDADDSSGLSGANYQTIWTEGLSSILIVDADATITDSDSSVLESMTVTITNLLDGTAESLSANVAGTGINASYDSGTGVLSLSGTDTVANYQQVLRSIVYDNSSDSPDTTSRIVTIEAADLFATSTVVTSTVSIVATNDAPVLSNLESTALTYTENAAATPVSNVILVSDADDANLESATIRISNNYVSGEDVLSFTNTGNINGTWDDTTGTLTLTGSDSLANYRSALRSVTYHNLSDAPATATRTLTIQVNDGDMDSNVQSRSIDIMAVNDVPLSGASGSTQPEDTTSMVILLSGSDVDGTVIAFQLNSLPSNGTLYTDASLTVIASIGVDYAATAEIRALYFVPDSDWNGTASFSYSAKDDAGDLSSVPGTANLYVTAVNDAPVRTAGTVSDLTVAEDSGLTSLGLSGLNYSTGGGIDEASQTLSYRVTAVPNAAIGEIVLADGTTVVTAGTTYTLAEIQGMQFRTAADANGGPETFSFTVTDDGTTNGSSDPVSIAETINVTVNAVNDAPVVDDGSNIGYSEGSGATAFTGKSIVDIDSTDFDGGVLSVLISSGSDGTDTLRIVPNYGATISGSNVIVSGVTIGTISGNLTNGPLTVTFNANAGLSDVLAVYHGISIQNLTDNPTPGARVVSVVLTDGDGGTSNTATATLTLTAINDAPFNNGSLPASVTVIEDVATAIDLSGMDVIDPDANAGELTLKLKTSTGGNINAAAAAGITISGNDSGSLSITGTLSNLNSYLNNSANISYLHSTGNLFGNSVDTIAVSINDNGNTGAGGSVDVLFGTINVDITPVNDATVIDLDADDSSGVTGQNFQTTFTEGGPAVAVSDSDATLTDIDSSTLAGITVKITNRLDAEEALTADTTGTALTAVWDTNTDTLTISGSGSIVDYQSVLQTVLYNNSSENPDTSTRNITFVANDGTSDSQIATTSLSVVAINNAPVILANSLTVTEGDSVTLTTANLDSVDPDNDPSALTWTVSGISGGHFERSGLATTSFTHQDVIDGLVSFIHDGSETPAAYSVSVSDGSLSTGPQPATVVYTVVNDSPAIGTNTGIMVQEGSTGNVIDSASLNESDPDDSGSELTYRLTSNVSNGVLRLDGTILGTNDTFTQAQVDLGSLTYDHDGSETTFDTFSFELTDGGEDGSTSATGSFSISVTNINDAPVLTTPGTQSTIEGTPTVFSTGNNNAISVSDSDAPELTVSIAVQDGTVTLSSIAGLSFVTGDGIADGTMTFDGTIADINAALDGMYFTNNINHDVIGTITIDISDNGFSGTGGVMTDSGSLDITINSPPAPPVVGDAFLQGSFVQVGLGADGAFGSDGVAPSGYALAGEQLALTSDPDKDGFGTYDGDFALPGSPEEGWGVQVGGISYNNNNNILTPEITGTLQGLTTTTSQQSVDWSGGVAGLQIDQTYTVLATELYVDVVVTLTNTTGSDMSNVYYMRNIDPDNNQAQGSADSFTTINTIVAQGNDGGGQAIVSATQSDGSYLALVGYGENARVSYGGFSNRNATDVFDATNGLNGAGSNTADEAISLAYKFTSISAGESVTAHYRYYLGQDSVPSIDLDSDNSTGISGADLWTQFTENGGPVGIADSDAFITDLGDSQLSGLTATISNLQDGASEILSVDTTGTSIVANYSAGTLTLSGNAAISEYTQVLRTLTYDNTSDAPSTTTRLIEVSVTDGIHSSNLATAHVTINALNDASVLSPVSPAFSTITEDDTANSGNLVSELLGNSVTDADVTAQQGMAITSINNSHGIWQFSIDGSNWNDIGTVSESSALLLRASHRVRFVPDTIDADTASISYRAWDRTSGIAGTKVDVTINGGTTAFSAASDTATISVTAVNDAPVQTVPGTQTVVEE